MALRQLAAFRRSENAADFYFEEFVVGPSFYLLLMTVVPRPGDCLVAAEPGAAVRRQVHRAGSSAQLHHDPLAARFVDLLQGLGFWGLAMIEVIA